MLIHSGFYYKSTSKLFKFEQVSQNKLGLPPESEPRTTIPSQERGKLTWSIKISGYEIQRMFFHINHSKERLGNSSHYIDLHLLLLLKPGIRAGDSESYDVQYPI